MNNKLIAICGMDATGKSTLSSCIQSELKCRGVPYIVTKQPSKLIKEWDCFKAVLRDNSQDINFKIIGGLISWDRLNIQIREVIPAIEAGYYVICERYIVDIIAWSKFRGAEDKWIRSWIAPLIEANRTFLCDASPELVLKRIMERKEGEKIGENTFENINSLLALYREAACNSNAYIISTSHTIDDLKNRVHVLMEEIIE